MYLTPVDWLVIVVYCIAMLYIGVVFTKRASRGVEDFFISGRKLTWWLAGTSIIATAYASDVPLFMTSLVRRYGVAGSWYYWNACLNGLLASFLFAPLWRRTRVVTDAEFREMRYSGRSGKAVRIIWAAHRGILSNVLGMGWVILAMVKVGKTALGLPPEITVLGMGLDSALVLALGSVLIALIYSVLSGLWGVVVTDFIQFIVALAGGIVLAWIALAKVGGPAELQRQIVSSHELGNDFLRFIPYSGIALTYFVFGITIQWWSSSWVDGGMMMAQRSLASINEWHAATGRYWGNLGQMAIITWPVVIVAACSVVLYPNASHPELVADPESAYPKIMMELLPQFWRGLVVSAFLAAFMSTIDSQLNSSSSYFINDLYKRFLVKNASEKHYVLMARIVMVILGAAGACVALLSKNVLTLSQLFVQITAGVGLVFVFRWLWWRVNAWSEISAYSAALAGTLMLDSPPGRLATNWIVLLLTPDSQSQRTTDFIMKTLPGTDGWPYRMVILVGLVTATWLIVTMLTAPTETQKLVEFYHKVKPYGPGWRKIARIAGPVTYTPSQMPFSWGYLLWGAVFYFSVFIAVGKLPFGYYVSGITALIIAAVSGYVFLPRLWSDPTRYTSDEHSNVEDKQNPQ